MRSGSLLRPARRRALSAGAAPHKVVSIVFGSFDKGYALRSAKAIYDAAPEGRLKVREPQSGEDFDFNSLQETDFLVLCTSSMNGFPPHNFAEFAHQLLLAAETGEEDCLSKLQHAVWGEGDERWLRTFMSVPRYMDLLLEDCGSRRFYSRGEANEPHAPTGSTQCEAEVWAGGMWEAAMRSTAAGDGGAPPVAWDAQWEYEPSPHHHDVTEWDLETLVRRCGTLARPPSSFARPDGVYHDMIEGVRREQEELRARAARRKAALAASAARAKE